MFRSFDSILFNGCKGSSLCLTQYTANYNVWNKLLNYTKSKERLPRVIVRKLWMNEACRFDHFKSIFWTILNILYVSLKLLSTLSLKDHCTAMCANVWPIIIRPQFHYSARVSCLDTKGFLKWHWPAYVCRRSKDGSGWLIRKLISIKNKSVTFHFLLILIKVTRTLDTSLRVHLVSSMWKIN